MFISQQNSVNHKGQKAIEIIIANQGKLDLKNIRNEVGISERSLESYFKNKCGMSGNDSNPQYFHTMTFEKLRLSQKKHQYFAVLCLILTFSLLCGL